MVQHFNKNAATRHAALAAVSLAALAPAQTQSAERADAIFAHVTSSNPQERAAARSALMGATDPVFEQVLFSAEDAVRDFCNPGNTYQISNQSSQQQLAHVLSGIASAGPRGVQGFDLVLQTLRHLDKDKQLSSLLGHTAVSALGEMAPFLSAEQSGVAQIFLRVEDIDPTELLPTDTFIYSDLQSAQLFQKRARLVLAALKQGSALDPHAEELAVQAITMHSREPERDIVDERDLAAARVLRWQERLEPESREVLADLIGRIRELGHEVFQQRIGMRETLDMAVSALLAHPEGDTAEVLAHHTRARFSPIQRERMESLNALMRFGHQAESAVSERLVQDLLVVIENDSEAEIASKAALTIQTVVPSRMQEGYQALSQRPEEELAARGRAVLERLDRQSGRGSGN